jgi:ketosteroid isomerase-like protein
MDRRVTDMSNTAVIREFYRAVAEKDAAELEKLITGHFDVDASVVFPGSLPYGGTVCGAGKLARMLGRMASSPEPVGAADLVFTGLIDGGDRIAVQVEFAWYPPGSRIPVPSSALELWTFEDGRVREIRAYYWDTAALINRKETACSSSPRNSAT